MRVRWLFPGVLSLFLLSNPAKAGQLQFWRFDSTQNRLEFTTDEGVQPKAQLIADPARLVIDLPGTVLGRPASTQLVGGAIRSIRVGQLDRQTTRLVIEIAPGYTIDPQQIRFRGVTASQWSVQLPTPQLVAQASSPDVSNGASESVPPPRGLSGNRRDSPQAEQ